MRKHQATTNEDDQPLMSLMQVTPGGACSVCLAHDEGAMMQMSCLHLVCGKCFVAKVAQGGDGGKFKCCVCTRVQSIEADVRGYCPNEVDDEKESQHLSGDEEELIDYNGEKEEDVDEEPSLTIVELENRTQGPDANIVVVGQTGSGKSQLVRSIVGRHVQPWAGAPTQLTRSGWWTPYKTDPKSKITWWDSKGIDSWSRNGALGLIEAMADLEAASFNVDFVVIAINEQQLVGTMVHPLYLLLAALNSLGKHVAIAVVNRGRSQEGLRARPMLSAVMKQLDGGSSTKEIGECLTQATMSNGGTVSLFATAPEVGTSDGSVSRFNTQELLLCILNALPHDRRVVFPLAAKKRPRHAHIPVFVLLLGWVGVTMTTLGLISAC